MSPTGAIDVVEKGSIFILAGNRISRLVGKIRNLVILTPKFKSGENIWNNLKWVWFWVVDCSYLA